MTMNHLGRQINLFLIMPPIKVDIIQFQWQQFFKMEVSTKRFTVEANGVTIVQQEK